MLKRFQLELKSHYEKLVIAHHIADMLEKFLMGRPAPLEIGAEQGGIEEWDDVVIMHTIGQIEHLQIKRQATDFCTKNPDKNIQLKRKTKDSSSDSTPAHSVLDKAFASLAKCALTGRFDKTPERLFKLTLISASSQIKNDLTVNHLDDLCNRCREDGLDLDKLANREDGPTNRAYLWLTTWCGFTDWKHIRDVLRRVHIYCIGNDARIRELTLVSLARYFRDPTRTLERLISYITAETSDVSALGCHAVLRAIRDELRPDVETWAQYQLSNGSSVASKSWSLSGTLDLKSENCNSAKAVVEHLWNNEPGNRKLRIYAPYSPPAGSNLTLPAAIVRMALHLPIGSQGLLLGESNWRNSVGHEVGHTFGCEEDDFNNLPWVENSERLACREDHEFDTLSASRKEAEDLAKAMDEVIWERLLQSVADKLSSITDPALADAMDTVWRQWVMEFTAAPETRRTFMNELLYPKTENKNEKHALRLGLRTLHLLVNAVEMLLLVSVGLSKGISSWKSFQQDDSVLSIALKYWSGPASGVSEVRELSDDPLITVIGPDPARIVVLPSISASPSALLNTGMADDADTSTSMAAERQPHLLVTRFGVYKQLRKGTLDSVRLHFSKQWHEHLLARESAIVNITKGS
ncbi:ABC-three component system protein [Pantoea vagans]|uniref:ABC-three component system protein n=1 Tax=Pantoea vagans TaxID=470934 RepID=UPI00366CBF81